VRCRITAFFCCKAHLVVERQRHPHFLLASFRTISKQSGIPVGLFFRAEEVLQRCNRELLTPDQQRLAIAETIWTAYQRAHKQGRDHQRRKAKQQAAAQDQHDAPDTPAPLESL
jgi:hypothetical protein